MTYKRILIKLSGEAMKGEREYGIDPKFMEYIAEEIQEAHKLGVEIAIVVGGGNIFRGVAGSQNGLDRATADYMGMLATVFNGMALQNILEQKGLNVRLQSAIEMKQVAEPYVRRRAMRHLEKGRIVIFGGGTGLPFITTDTTAVMRALEVGCEAVFKATKVDGVYEEDPEKNPKAKKLKKITLDEAFKNDNIRVMDKSAVELCRNNNLSIVVFDIYKKGNLKKVVSGEDVGSLIC
jgi:uridylate kinase